VDRLVPNPMAAATFQRVEDTAFHLPDFLIQNLSREIQGLKTCIHDSARTIVLTLTLPSPLCEGRADPSSHVYYM